MVAMFFFLLLAGVCSFLYILKILQPKHKTNPTPPGPPGLPIIGHLHMLGGLPHHTLQRLSQKYGPIIGLRLGTAPAVVVSSAEAAELFLKTHDLNFISRPSSQLSDIASYGSKGVGSSQYGPHWRNLRRICTIHLLSISKVGSYMSLRKEEVGFFISSLKSAADSREVVDISARVGSVIQKISYAMIFGRGYQEKYNFKPYVEENLSMAGVFNIGDFVTLLKPFDLQGLCRRAKKLHKIMDEYLEKIIQEHEQNAIGKAENPTDFIDVMLSLMKSDNVFEEQLDRTTIKALTMDMLGGSLDTSSSTIEWALTELVTHPQVMKKLQEELVNIVGLNRTVEEADLPKLDYLNMVVKETMRLHPVVPLLLPRESIEDILIGGYHIAKSTRIIVNAWAIGRDPKTWSNNAEEFNPERFMNSNVDVRGNDIQLIPFGSGRRKCPALELGLRQVHFVLAQLVHCFDLELPDGVSPRDVDMKELFGLTTPRANPLLVAPVYRLQVSDVSS
ncbi:hypothetical protein ACHQM5_005732 [Ranunculus cassubicifolius]